MPVPGDRELIELWERGVSRSPLDRALLLLGVAAPELPPPTIADLSLATRDLRVLELRTTMFGGHFSGVADCPACAEPLEFAFDRRALDVPMPADDAAFVANNGLRFRLPSSRDVAAALSASGNDDAIAHSLVQRCCVNAEGDTTWNKALLDEAEAGLDALAEQSGLTLQFRCEACGATWQTPLDICGWLWREVDRRARMLLDEVHQLAWSYGWDEERILAMSQVRRAAYLERCSPI
jgi:hypothetical protein